MPLPLPQADQPQHQRRMMTTLVLRPEVDRVPVFLHVISQLPQQNHVLPGPDQEVMSPLSERPQELVPDEGRIRHQE